MKDSYVKFGTHGATSYVGPDGVNLMRAKVLLGALRLAKVGIQATRSISRTRTLQLVTEYTGKRYKRGQYDAAIADMLQWIRAMEAAMPIVEDEQ